MYRATDGIMLPTGIIGSLPRPVWYTENLGRRSFMEAMVNTRFREQYNDAVVSFIHDQELAGLDIYTDGDAHYDTEVNGASWTTYPLSRLGGVDASDAYRRPQVRGRFMFPRGHILHEGMESRASFVINGPITRGSLQYMPLWLAAQRQTRKPIKFGTITPELLALAARDDYYKDRRQCIMAVSEALHEELVELADAGCAAIQMEEPQIHLLNLRPAPDLDVDFMVKVFNNTVRGLRAKTEIWCHTCWGNPAQQRMFAEAQSYAPYLATINQCDADIVTFETCASGGMDIEAIGREITGKKVGIGVIDHHTLQVETSEQVAGLIRRALKVIPAERLVITSDCGMGREGMSRKHAFYKMVAMVQGTNIVRRELGLPLAEALSADPHFSLVEQLA